MSPSHTVRPARPLCRVAHTAAASAPLAGRGRLLGLSAHTWLHSAQTSQAWCNGGYKETYSPAPALPVASTFSLRHLRKTGHFLGCLPQLWTVEGERGLLSWNRSYHMGTRPTTAERGRGHFYSPNGPHPITAWQTLPEAHRPTTASAVVVLRCGRDPYCSIIPTTDGDGASSQMSKCNICNISINSLAPQFGTLSVSDARLPAAAPLLEHSQQSEAAVLT